MRLYSIHSLKRTVFITVMLLAGLITQAHSQLVEIRSVPVAGLNQFDIFPAKFKGMGSVGIANDDPWLAPFVNPALGAAMEKNMVFLSPTLHNMVDDRSSATTLPVGLQLKPGPWFGTFAMSIQELTPARIPVQNVRFNQPRYSQTTQSLSESENNVYVNTTAGYQLPRFGTSIGLGVFWSHLRNVSETHYLYGRNTGIDQDGHVWDVRLGSFTEFEERESLQTLLLLRYYKMKHKVYNFYYYDDIAYPDETSHAGIPGLIHRDQTRTIGFHINYKQPLGGSPWRVGSAFSVNYKDHPKIPNYELMQIPRDPGQSWAYRLGMGFWKEVTYAAIGFDFIYEPIWTHSWAAAVEPVKTASDQTIHPGETTIDNYFRFNNFRFHAGVSEQEPPLGVQLGLDIVSFGYHLSQDDQVAETKRDQYERWQEVTLSWGLNLIADAFRLQYDGKVIIGRGLPGTVSSGRAFATGDQMAFTDIILAPVDKLSLERRTFLLHRLTLAVPIGG